MAAVRDHYQVLGVDPKSSRENIRRAHRDLMLALHPDRHAVSTPAEKALAERRMREINDAWNVLGDPTRRYSYDRKRDATRSAAQSARQASSNGRGPSAGSGTPRRSEPVVYEPDFDDADELAVHPGTFFLLRRGPVIVMAVVVALLFVLSAYAGDRGGSDGRVTGEGCILLTDGSDGIRVDCALPNDGEIVEEVEAPLDCSEGNRYVQVGAEFFCIPIE